MSTPNEGRPSSKDMSAPCPSFSPEENQLVLSFIRPGCKSYSTSMAQLFQTAPPKFLVWVKQYSGVLCLEKDQHKRSYFMRMYCLNNGQIIWEQEFYYEMIISLDKPFFVSFEGAVGVVGLNFANNAEAAYFYKISGQILKKLNQALVIAQSKTHLIVPKPTKVKDRSKKTKSNKKHKDMQINAEGPSKKITRADIGAPKNFVHINTVMHSPLVQNFLKSAGITEAQLKDAKMFQHIYQFIVQIGVEDILKTLENNQSNGDKKPQHYIIARQLPPVPVPEMEMRPNSRPLPDVPIQRPPSLGEAPPPPEKRGTLPQRPIPPPKPEVKPSIASGPVPPPPPPMCPQPAPMLTLTPPTSVTPIPKSSGPKHPVLENTRDDMLKKIKGGEFNLRPTGERKNIESCQTASATKNPRDELLESIRKGPKLKPVDPSSPMSPSENRISTGPITVEVLGAQLNNFLEILNKREDACRYSSSEEEVLSDWGE